MSKIIFDWTLRVQLMKSHRCFKEWLRPNTRWAIIWNNDEPFNRRIYASLSFVGVLTFVTVIEYWLTWTYSSDNGQATSLLLIIFAVRNHSTFRLVATVVYRLICVNNIWNQHEMVAFSRHFRMRLFTENDCISLKFITNGYSSKSVLVLVL